MPPTADQIAQIKNILQLYKTHVKTAVVKHKTTVKKNLSEIDRRKVEKIRRQLQKY
ncbi:hypothetical protein KKF59_02550 [Patescibacteria group bacterium]|nr:hypothetical protein [Patescibacteria group bacterium]MBU1034564.1 hypothetical protein [Patescibacteria group bacterium]MBU1907990.1 hypothetical protein [Patescibacteria group bacterium]